MSLVLTGTIIPFDPDGPEVVARGAVYVDDTGTVEAVQPASRRAPAGYTGAPRFASGGLVFPGLIDLHNHLAYNTLPLWRAPATRRTAPATSGQGPRPTAATSRTRPRPTARRRPAAALRYAEVKAIVGGVTAIQGSPPLTRAFPGWMVRNVEKEKVGGEIPWRQAVIPKDREGLTTVRPGPRGGALVRLPPGRGQGPRAPQGVRGPEGDGVHPSPAGRDPQHGPRS